jgi:hypothetical protein
MPPIHLSRSERASLSKIVERPRMAGEIPADHAEKFINYDLAHKQVLLLYITPLGQIAYLRQHYGEVKPAMPRHTPPHKNLLPPMRKRLLLTNRLQEGA